MTSHHAFAGECVRFTRPSRRLAADGGGRRRPRWQRQRGGGDGQGEARLSCAARRFASAQRACKQRVRPRSQRQDRRRDTRHGGRLCIAQLVRRSRGQVRSAARVRPRDGRQLAMLHLARQGKRAPPELPSAAVSQQTTRRLRVAPCAQACVSQGNVDADLAHLPVFLSGCRGLLVLLGPTYTSRLWYARARSKRVLP